MSDDHPSGLPAGGSDEHLAGLPVGGQVEGWDDESAVEPAVSPAPAPSRAMRRKGAVPGGDRPRGRGRGWLAALAVLVIALGVLGGLVYWQLYSTAVTAGPGQPVKIEIPRGAGVADIGKLLADSGVVGNANMFRLRVKLDKDTTPLKAGVYQMTTGMGYDSAVAMLREGPPVLYFTVAVPEGWTVPQIAKRMEAQAGVSADEFTRIATKGAADFDYPFLRSNRTGSLEGFLFPKTYRIKVGTGPHDIIDQMLRQFGKETAQLDMSYPQSRNMNMSDVVTIASMIERETRVERDRPLVASVIYNRLSRDMRLEIDATVQYVVGNKARLLYRDLRVRSPYNTYLHKGLPPGPIASPGLPALQAAVKPARTKYLYYVLTHRNGMHSFASSSAEFERLKAAGRRLR